jgi:uncharacterized protein (TIGR00251 family)
MSWYRWSGEDLLIDVQVQPRASRDEIVGPHGDCIKVRITAPPVEGRANTHLTEFLAAGFGVPKSQVALVSGTGTRRKRLRIRAPRRLPEVLAQHMVVPPPPTTR